MTPVYFLNLFQAARFHLSSDSSGNPFALVTCLEMSLARKTTATINSSVPSMSRTARVIPRISIVNLSDSCCVGIPRIELESSSYQDDVLTIAPYAIKSSHATGLEPITGPFTGPALPIELYNHWTKSRVWLVPAPLKGN